MAVYASLNCFNAGELSPKMLGRSDVSQYSKGCRTLRNFLVTPYGAVERRPGTKYLYPVKFADRKVRLIRFVYSSDIAYLCEFGEKYVRFYYNDAPVMNGGNILEVATPYGEKDLAAIQFVQSADVMTIVHPSYPVMELKRTAVNNFTLSEKEYEYPPMLDPNLDDDHILTPSAREGDITLTASKDTFTSGNVGGFFQLVHTRRNNEISRDFMFNGTTESIEVYGFWTFTTHGTWMGTLKIQRSYDNGATWNDYRTYDSAGDQNITTSGEEEEKDVLYRIVLEDYIPAPESEGTLRFCRVLFSNPDFITTGVVKITSVENARTAYGTVTNKLGELRETREWNEGAWSNRRGFPRTVAYYEERMIFGGTSYRPQTIWGSVTNDWDNFLLSSKDDAGLEFTLASDTVNTICWMCQHNALIIGTMDSEWTLSASDAAKALTPSDFRIRRQSVYGSQGKSAQMVGDTVLFVQRGGRKVREFVFQWEKDGYSSPDMTVLADHITESGIRETTLQQLPDSILWCVLNDGTLAALTYERDQQVVGWHKHTTDGKVISCCVVPSRENDTIYLAVERNGKILLEKFMPRKYTGIQNAFYVDCGSTVTGKNITQISGISHLEGKTLQILADGALQEQKTVVNGSITLDEAADKVTFGLPFASVLSPMPMELEMQNGHSVLRQKCIGELRIRTYNSVGGEVRCGKDAWQQVISRDVLLDRMDTAVSQKDDVSVFNVLSGKEYTPFVEIRQTDPLPMNINNMVITYEVQEY